MAKGFKTGAGGANPLNFKVVGGTTVPANPKENMIWVNTDRKITGYYFTSLQPENMAEGEVWFFTGTTRQGVFNALKKNTVEVCPMSAKQMIDDSLVEIPASIYQNGEWVSWFAYLYNAGDECTVLTGGWTAEPKRYVSGLTVTTSDYTFARNEDNLYIKKSGTGYGNIMYAKNPIDLSLYSTLHFGGTMDDGDSGQYADRVRLCIWSSIGTYSTDNIVAQLTGNRTDGTINISSLTGEYMIGFLVYGSASVKLTSMYLT